MNGMKVKSHLRAGSCITYWCATWTDDADADQHTCSFDYLTKQDAAAAARDLGARGKIITFDVTTCAI